MRRAAIITIMMLQLVFITGCLSDYNSKPVCRIEDERLVFRFDLRWNEEQRMEVAARYELDSAIVDAAYGFVPEITKDSITWEIRKMNRNFVEFSKPVISSNFSFFQNNDVFMIEDGWVRRDEVSPKAEVVYGFNELRREDIFTYSDSMATFFLRNNENAGEVFLSGSFNDWSTMDLPMKKESGGWRIKILLEPGKYTYKYIVDGRWLSDPDNLLKERESNRGIVSVIFCPNHIFRLTEKPGTKRSVVQLTGNFINWNRRGLKMKENEGSWELPVYLRDGTYAYKFIVDNDWLTDPANPDTRTDADGNMNSFLSIGKTQRFFLAGYSDAEKVVLSGSFNGWSVNELVMKKINEGWELEYAIPAGIYEYKFLVDGRWMPDPANKYTSGSGNYTNSVIAVQPAHTFILEGHADASEVIVTGSFNNWSPNSYRMVRTDGKWIFPAYLRQGKVLYKFIVDGKWILDPANELWEENEWGTGNSVLWVGR